MGHPRPRGQHRAHTQTHPYRAGPEPGIGPAAYAAPTDPPQPSTTRLGIWAGIRFTPDGEVDPSSGSFKVMPFQPADDDLFPLSYDWCVPDQT